DTPLFVHQRQHRDWVHRVAKYCIREVTTAQERPFVGYHLKACPPSGQCRGGECLDRQHICEPAFFPCAPRAIQDVRSGKTLITKHSGRRHHPKSIPVLSALPGTAPYLL